MLRVLGNRRRFCDGVTRREALTVGALSVLGGGFNLPTLLARKSSGRATPGRGKAKRPSPLPARRRPDPGHVRPQARRPGRGPRRVQADRDQRRRHSDLRAPAANGAVDAPLAVVRSVNHKAGCHNTLPSFTGSEQPVDVNDPIPQELLSRRAWARSASTCKPPDVDLPHYVALPDYLGWGFALRAAWSARAASSASAATRSAARCNPKIDPNRPPGRRPMWLGTPLPGRHRSRARHDARPPRRPPQPAAAARRPAAAGRSTGGAGRLDRVRQRAFGLLTGRSSRRRSTSNAEDPRLRDRYGRHLFGSSALARPAADRGRGALRRTSTGTATRAGADRTSIRTGTRTARTSCS